MLNGMADTIFYPRRLHPGDIVRTEDRRKFYRVYSVSKDFVVLENDEENHQRYFFSVYPIKLQDTKAMEALGIEVCKEWNDIHKRFLRKYKIGRGDFIVTMREMEMGYFRIEIKDMAHYQVIEQNVVRYYFHEVQQYFFEKTATELFIELPDKTDFDMEYVHFWDEEGQEVLV